MQNNQDQETHKDEVEREYKRIQKKCRWGPDFSAPVQTGSEGHPASYAMGTGSLSRG